MLERIWSGWRASYVDTQPAKSDPEAREGSVFTQLLRCGEPDEATHILRRGEEVFAILNIFPYCAAHTLVLPYREVADIADLTVSESTELWSMINEAVATVRSVYRPEGMNVGFNLGRPAGGSVPTHLHAHVVPRYTGDSNFMSSVANTQTLPEALEVTAARLRAAWPA